MWNHGNPGYNGLRNDKEKYPLPKEARIVKLIIGYWTVPEKEADFFKVKVDNKEITEKQISEQIKKYREIYTKMNGELDDFISEVDKIKNQIFKNEINFEVKKLTVNEIITCQKKENMPKLKRYI